MKDRGDVIKALFLLVLVGIVLCVWYALFLLESHRVPTVIFFDIGQGDSVFIEAPNGNQVLIDGGPGASILSKLGREMPFWDHSIDLLVLTHPHLDHLEGLIEVLKRYEIGMIVTSGAQYTTPEYREWKKRIEEKNIRVSVPHAGDRLNLAEDIFLDVFLPFKDYSASAPKEIHDAMVVTKLTIGRNSIFLAGDMEKELEYQLVFFGFPIDSDILKVGHHGSQTSSAQGFLEHITPDVSIISAGKDNRYGHPHASVLERLKHVSRSLFRTDEHGDIRILFSGESFAVE